MKRAPGCALLALLSTSACSDAQSYIAWPTLDPSTESILLIANRPNKSEVFAFAADDLAALELDASQLQRVTILQYTETLEAFDLDPGPQAFTEPDACAAWNPPEPKVSDVLDLSAGADSFERLGKVPGLDRLALARPCPCRDFDVEVFELGSSGLTYGIERAADGSWAVLTAETLFLLDPSFAVSSTITRPKDTGTFHFMMGLEDGRLRILTADGWLLERAPGSSELTPLARAQTGSAIEVAGASDGSEAIVPDDEGRVFIFDGSEFAPIPGDTSDTGSNQHGTAAWLGSEHFVFGRRLGNGLFERTSQGAQLEKRAWDSGLKPISRLRYVEGVGLFLFTKTNTTHIRPDGESELVDYPIENLDYFVDGIHSAAAWEEGWIAGGRGALRQWHPRSGYCPPVVLDDKYDVGFEVLIPLDDTILVGAGSGGMETQVFVFRRRE